ncbi:MAG: LysM peptidoglycan-binding domain-containing protein, partial [Chloroflexi bacterium]|nr:LysM peptidoglycan-binding domain-containing protein [Chloroflexota bacterium]
PAPTPTPTITPTPVVHIIASGDTLIGIASRYGVSVEAIQEANGITDPRLLSIGQSLIIPTDASAQLGSGTPTPVPTPLPVVIEGIHFGHDPSGDMWALGMVRNPGQGALEGISIRLSLTDDAGVELAAASAFVLDDVLLPGAHSAFGVRLRQAPDFSNYVAEALTVWPAHSAAYYFDLEPRNVQSRGEGYRTQWLQGEVVNTGPEASANIVVSAILFDALDRVIGFRRSEPWPSVLPPGNAMPFQLEIIPMGGPVDHYELHVLGRRLSTPTPTS